MARSTVPDARLLRRAGLTAEERGASGLAAVRTGWHLELALEHLAEHGLGFVANPFGS